MMEQGKNLGQLAGKLKEQLEKHGIPLDQWGKGQAKTFQHLLKEMAENECELVEDEEKGLVRRVSVLGIDIYYQPQGSERLRLFEEKQVFIDGRERRRSLPTSMGEKLTPGEDLDQAAKRAIREELGITDGVQAQYIKTLRNERVSDSFPGLLSQYVNHFYEANLTEKQYNPEGFKEVQEDKTTYFAWRQA
jgi:hypothetical protein